MVCNDELREIVFSDECGLDPLHDSDSDSSQDGDEALTYVDQIDDEWWEAAAVSASGS